MNKISDIISFYRDCYQVDLKGIRITNFLSTQCEKRYVPDDNELFQSRIRSIPVDSDWAEEVEKILLLNSKEKALYGGSVFIKGHRSVLGRKTTSCIPLYIHEFNLSRVDDVYFISISDSYLNPDFVELINLKDRDRSFNLDYYTEQLPIDPFGFENIVKVNLFFETHYESWDTKGILNYDDPALNFKKGISGLKKDSPDLLKIYPSFMIGIFKKQQGSLGVLDELSELIKKERSSSLLEQLFELKEIEDQTVEERKLFAPSSLSESQEDALYNAASYPISLVIGPPGTGKSYTISALTMDAVCRQKSVLVASKNSQATRVISNMLERDFKLKGFVIKADKQIYKRGLASRLSRIISRNTKKKHFVRESREKLNKLDKSINSLIADIDKSESDEIAWGEFYAQYENTFFSKFKSKWIEYKRRKSIPIWRNIDVLRIQYEQKNRALQLYVKAIMNDTLIKTLESKRWEFLNLVEALREKSLTQAHKKIDAVDFKLILKALPIWTSTTKDVSKNLPLEKELFDIVIIDEASQCDMASILPVIYRAKKVIVVGDPQQLRHVSFLSDEKQRNLRMKYRLDQRVPDYRRDSFIDCVNRILRSQNQVTSLCDHFRSKPAIIRFSNEKFYDNSLKVLRANPIGDEVAALSVNQVKGVRDDKGVNRAESQALMGYLTNLLKEYASVMPELSPSIGIISPFASQTSHLKSIVLKEVSSELIKKHRILIGTPHHFQGEERDVVLISYAVDNDSHFGSINYLNKEDVFNVLITRARNSQVVFASVEPTELSETSLLRSYLETNHNRPVENESSRYYDSFMDEVSELLRSLGNWKIYENIEVSGVRIDLTVVSENEFYCIDLIGYPGEFESRFSEQNMKMLHLMKVPVFFLPYSSWYLDREKTKSNLMRYLKISDS